MSFITAATSRVRDRAIASTAQQAGAVIGSTLEGALPEVRFAESTWGDVVRQQLLIRIVGPAHELVPETAAAADLLGAADSPVRDALRGYASLVKATAGVAPSGISLTTSVSGELAHQLLDFLQQFPQHLPRSVDEMQELVQAFVKGGPHPMEAAIDGSRWVLLASEPSAGMLGHLRHLGGQPGGAVLDARAGARLSYLLSHESRHLGQDREAPFWLAEAAAEMLGRRSAAVRAISESLRLPHDLPSTGRSVVDQFPEIRSHPYTEWADTLQGLWRRAGIDVETENGAAFAERAMRGRLVSVPADLARRIGVREGLGDHDIERLGEFIDLLGGDVGTNRLITTYVTERTAAAARRSAT